jgi:general L-amino acid transport system permease protein
MTDLAERSGGPASLAVPQSEPKVAWYNDPGVRSFGYQAITLAIVAFLVWGAYSNASRATTERGIFRGFELWDTEAGFSIGFSFLPFSINDSLFWAFVVGTSNTLLVAVVGILLATLIGFVIGLARLSSNWLISHLAYWYVEIFRNTPLLLILVLFYSFKDALPQVRGIPENPLGVYVTVRGVFAPKPVLGEGGGMVLWALLFAIVLAVGVVIWANRRRMLTGKGFPSVSAAFGVVVGLPLLVFLALGAPLTWDVPRPGGFNIQGGMTMPPEFVAVLAALTLYTAAFIAENVRAGVTAISRGQSEAAGAIGLTRGQAMRLVIVPQALRIIIPPMTNQYLNLTKNSTLATAIGYPEIINVGNSALQKVPSAEVVLVWMGVFLFLSLLTSLIMNWYNARIALAER